MNRLVILPDETLHPLASSLRLRLEAIAREVSAQNLATLLDPLVSGMVGELATSTKTEALLWGASRACHSAVWASETAQDLVFRATADSKEGLVARVFESGRGTVSGECESLSQEWTNLPRLRGRDVFSMACVPVNLAGRIVGTLSLFSMDSEIDCHLLGPLGRSAEIFSRIAEARILRECLAIESP
jgi:hypothetical protein